MKIVEVLDSLLEARGSKAGREVYGSKEGTKRNVKKSFKGRVRTYNSISDALGSGQYGEIFTTKAAGRLYVISKGKWGAKSGRGKIAKGFTPGSSTPSSGWGSIKKHAARTMLRYGRASDKLAQTYGSRSIKKERGLKYK
jgi:hypothetical protein